MGLYTQSPDNRLLTSTQALPAWAVIAFTLFEYLANVFSPQNHLDYPAHPVVRASRTVPLPASRVILSGPSSAVASSSVIAVVFGVLLVFYVMVISLVCWSFKCAATSKGRPHGRSSPSHSSPPTDIDERGELLEDEANSDVLVDQSSDGEDEEANGDGADPGDDQNDNIDEVNKGSVLRPLSSAEDPPPPPDPPTQTTAADPDLNPYEVLLWYILFLVASSVPAFLVLKWALLRLRRTLRKAKVYTGRSVFNLFIYIEDPSCRVFVPTEVISSLAGVGGFAAPLQLDDSDAVWQGVPLDNASILEVLLRPPVPMVVLVIAALVVVMVIDACWQARDGKDNELISQVEYIKDVDEEEVEVVLADNVKEPLVISADLQHTLGYWPLKHKINLTPATTAVDVRILNFSPPSIAGFKDHEVESTTEVAVTSPSPPLPPIEVNVSSLNDSVSQEEHVCSTSLLDFDVSSTVQGEDRTFSFNNSIILSQRSLFSESDFMVPNFMVPNNLGMVSVETDTNTPIQEVVEEECKDTSVLEDVNPVAQVKNGDIESPDVGAALTVWRGEGIIIHTPPTTPAFHCPSRVGTPEAMAAHHYCLPPLPRRVLELRGFPSFSPVQHPHFHSTPKQVMASHPPVDTTTVCSVGKGPAILSESSQLSLISGSERPSFEVEQSTLVEADNFCVRKADGSNKLHAVVEDVFISPEHGPLLEVVELEVDEGGVVEDSEVVLKENEKENLAVEDKLTDGMHPSGHSPAEIICSKEDSGEEKQLNTPVPVIHAAEDDCEIAINFVDGAGVYRYFMPHLDIYRSLSPMVIGGPAVPTFSPPTVYCPCCPAMKLEWDELSMVDDIVAELRCISIPHGLLDYHFELAVEDDMEDLVEEGVDLTMWGCECVVIDLDDEEEEGEEEERERELLEGSYEEDAMWIADSDEEGVEEEEEAEVEKELLWALFDKRSVSSENAQVERQNSGNDTFDLEQLLLDFYGPNGQLLANVLPPDFDVADILDASDDVVPAFEDALASKQSAPASIEDAPPRIVTSTTEHDPPTANFESASGAVVAAVDELPNFHPTWPWRRVTGEAENVENTEEDLGRWKLSPVSVPPTPSPCDMQNELQQMRAKLRPPPNMTEQQKRLRRVWDLQGTDKGQVLKERLLRKA